MIQLCGVNPFAEAMLYYAGKANNKSIAKKLAEAIKQYPNEKASLIKAAQPAKTLEKLLDSKLNIDAALIDKYFKKLDNRYPELPFGFCLAFIMVINPLMNHIEYSAEELIDYLHKCTKADRMYSFRFALADRYETIYHDQDAEKEFMKRIDDANFSLSDKWKVLNAFFEYQTYIDELSSLILPAAELIKSAESSYAPATEDFFKIYAGKKGENILESYFAFKINRCYATKLAPLLFGFDKACAIFQSEDSTDLAENTELTPPEDTDGIFVGIAKYILKCSVQNEISTLSDKMQALSDSTRLEILFYLCSHREYGQELCTRFGLVRPALSYHIAKLQSAGFVTAETTGGKTYYEADKEGIQRMLDSFAEKIK